MPPPRDRYNSAVSNRRTMPREMLIDMLRGAGAPRATAEGAGTLYDFTPMSEAYKFGDALRRDDTGDAIWSGAGLAAAPFVAGFGGLKKLGQRYTGNVRHIDKSEQYRQDALANPNITPQLLKQLRGRIRLSGKPVNPETIRRELSLQDMDTLLDRGTIGFRGTLDRMKPQDPLHADALRREVRRMSRTSRDKRKDPLERPLMERVRDKHDDLIQSQAEAYHPADFPDFDQDWFDATSEEIEKLERILNRNPGAVPTPPRN
jgi:hypothetical protein